MDSFAETTTGLLLTANGYDTPLFWDGLTAQMEPVGLDAPTSTPALTGSGTGAIVGDYYAYVRFVDRFGYFSNLSPISTVYSASGATGTITGATNASPIVVTSAAHGLLTGATVKIEGVGGNTSANNTFTITVVDADTFSLDDSHGTADYDGGGTWTSGVGTISYSSIQVPTSSRVVRRQILRNTDGQTDTFYVDVDSTDLNATTFTSTKTDTTLAAQESQALLNSDGLTLANRHTPPVNHKPVLASLLDRMFLAGSVDETRGSVKVEFGSTTVTGVGTGWSGGLAGRYFYVTGHTQSYEIDSVDTSAQTLTLTSAYQGVTDKFAVYAIRPAPAERKLVYYSEAGLPFSWPATNALQVQDDGDDITGLMAKGPFLYILERRHIYKLTFQDDPAKDGAIFRSASRGCLNNNCWVQVDEDAYLLDEHGIYRFTGRSDVQNLSRSIQNMFRPGSSNKYRINWQAARHFFALLYRPQEVIRWFVAFSGCYLPRHALCYNYRLDRWWVEEYPIGLGSGTPGFVGGLPYAFVGAEHRKVLALWEGTQDLCNVAGGTTRGTATAASTLTLTDSTAAFSTSIANAPVTIIEGKGKGQTRRVVSSTATVLTVDQPWLVSLDATSKYQIGGVVWKFQTSRLRWAPNEDDIQRRVEVMFSPTGSPCTMDLKINSDFNTVADTQRITMPSSQGGSVKTTSGDTFAIVDLTRGDGIVDHVLPGHREYFAAGKRLVQLELSGATNADPVTISQITIEGAGNQATLPGEGQQQ